MKQYKKMKDSGVEWIGEIPEDWKILRLKHISDIRPSNVDKHVYKDEIQVNLCNYTDVYYNEKITKALGLHKGSVNKNELDKFSLKIGDVILTKDSESADDIGVPALVSDNLLNTVCAYHLTLISAKAARSLGAFIFRFIQSTGVRNHFEVEANGITRFGLSKATIENLLIPVPLLSEQSHIVSFLDDKTAKIDSLIEKKQRKIELLREKRKALINQAVTKGLNPDAPMKDSGVDWIGEIPEGWQKARMRYLCEIQTGFKDTQDKVPGSYYPFFVRSDNIERIPTYSFDTEAILTAGDGVGVCKVFHHYKGKFEAHQRVYVLNNFKKVTGRFLYYYIRENFIKEVIRLSAKSTVDSLRRHMFENFPVIVPSIKEQKKIVDFLDEQTSEIDQLITKENQKIELLKEYRQSLISEAVTGKIDVRDYVKVSANSADKSSEEEKGAAA